MQEFIEQHFGKENIIQIETLAKAGSDRKYARIVTEKGTFIACENENIAENKSFIYFSNQFTKVNIPVPQIVAINEKGTIYIQEDLGDETLLNAVIKQGHTENIKSYYEAALKELAHMQIKGHEFIDYNQCFASKQFDKSMVLADLNYFKYYFLDLNEIQYDKMKLNAEFEQLSNEIDLIQPQYFMFRDYQGRNIMIRNEQPVFIDFQGGMKGPLQYDVASLLWQAKAQLPMAWKEDLFNHYTNELKQYIKFEDSEFRNSYGKLVLIRLLQVLGAYGLRGLIEKRAHFLSSIPQGLNNIKEWLSQFELTNYPELCKILHALTNQDLIKKYTSIMANDNSKLKIIVQSFSYKIGGIPVDESGNGGGFVFDCRGVLNPGRFEEYKKLTGRDQPVIDFLESKTKIHELLDGAKQVVAISVEDYIERGFENLMISFGCTGGQHRSVYCADAMAKHLQEKYHVQVQVKHVRQEEKNWVN